MKRYQSMMFAAGRVLLAVGLPVVFAQATAAEYWLKTGTTTVMGVPMWGYASCTDGSFGNGSTAGTCNPVVVPGPETLEDHDANCRAR